MDAVAPYIVCMPRHDPVDRVPRPIEGMRPGVTPRGELARRNHGVAAMALKKAGEVFAAGGLTADEIVKLHGLVSTLRESGFTSASLHRLLHFIANLGGADGGADPAPVPVYPRSGGPELEGGAAVALDFDDGDPDDQPAPRRRPH